MSLSKSIISFRLSRGGGRLCVGEKTKGLQVPDKGAEGDGMCGDSGDLRPLGPGSLYQVLDSVSQGCGGEGDLATIKEKVIQLKFYLKSLPPPIQVFLVPQQRVVLHKLKSKGWGLEVRN